MRPCIKGMNPEWYTIEAENDEQEPVKFKIKPLDGFGRTDIGMTSLSLESDEGGAVVASREVLKLAFRLGVKDWSNIEDAENLGNELPFSIGAMCLIQPVWIMEVGAKILQISDLGALEAKNSASPSSSRKT